MSGRCNAVSLHHNRLLLQKLPWQAENCMARQRSSPWSYCLALTAKCSRSKEHKYFARFKISSSLNLDVTAICEDFSVVRENQRVPQLTSLQEKIFNFQHVREAGLCKQGALQIFLQNSVKCILSLATSNPCKRFLPQPNTNTEEIGEFHVAVVNDHWESQSSTDCRRNYKATTLAEFGN